MVTDSQALGRRTFAIAGLAVLLTGLVAGGLHAQDDGTRERAVEGIEWRLVGTEDVRIRLDGGVATLTDGCGSLATGYVIEPELVGLRFEELAGSTLCRTSDQVVAALADVDGYEVGPTTLRLVDDGAVPLLELERLGEPAATPSGRWRVRAYDLRGDGLVDPLAGSDLTVTFDDEGILGGTTGCGELIGGYALDGPMLRIGVQTTGVAPCEPALRDEELDVTSALTLVAAWRATAAGLELVDEAGATRLVLERAATASLDGEWTVVRFTTPGGRTLEPIPGVEVWIGFRPDGRTEGSSGCRLFDGPYALDGERITIGPLSPIGQPCEGDVERQERRLLRTLAAAATWTATDGGLGLGDGAGGTLVELAARAPGG